MSALHIWSIEVKVPLKFWKNKAEPIIGPQTGNQNSHVNHTVYSVFNKCTSSAGKVIQRSPVRVPVQSSFLDQFFKSAFDKGPARIETSGPIFFFYIYILVLLVSKQFATFLHISLK